MIRKGEISSEYPFSLENPATGTLAQPTRTTCYHNYNHAWLQLRILQHTLIVIIYNHGHTMHDTHPYNLQPNKLVVVCITTLNHDPDSNGFKQHCIYMVHTQLQPDHGAVYIA